MTLIYLNIDKNNKLRETIFYLQGIVMVNCNRHFKSLFNKYSQIFFLALTLIISTITCANTIKLEPLPE